MHHRRPSNSGTLAKAILAGLLALLLVAAAVTAVSHRMHHAAHDEANAGHLCLLCLLVKGQVYAADFQAILAVFVSTLFFFIPSLQAGLFAVADRRLSPSRAPPLPAVSF